MSLMSEGGLGVTSAGCTSACIWLEERRWSLILDKAPEMLQQKCRALVAQSTAGWIGLRADLKGGHRPRGILRVFQLKGALMAALLNILDCHSDLRTHSHACSHHFTYASLQNARHQSCCDLPGRRQADMGVWHCYGASQMQLYVNRSSHERLQRGQVCMQ